MTRLPPEPPATRLPPAVLVSPAPYAPDSFAHDAARAQARSASARATVVLAVVAGLVVAAAPLAPLVSAPWLWPAAGASAAVLLVLAGWTWRCVARCHRVLVRLDFSPGGVLATEASGQRRAVPWARVYALNLDADGAVEIVVQEPGGAWACLRAGADWPRADALARRAVRYAHAHRCPLSVDGVACEALSIAPLEAVLAAPPRDAA